MRAAIVAAALAAATLTPAPAHAATEPRNILGGAIHVRGDRPIGVECDSIFGAQHVKVSPPINTEDYICSDVRSFWVPKNRTAQRWTSDPVWEAPAWHDYAWGGTTHGRRYLVRNATLTLRLVRA